MNNVESLKAGIEFYNIEATPEVLERFDIYFKMLLEWNEKMNLTAITDEKEVIEKHFLDSISCVQSSLDFTKSKAIDIGTGAGFPGVPMKIIFPDMDLTLMDSLKKRTVFLGELMDKLGLKCSIVHGRAEDFGAKSGYREAYDIAFSRAVANMNVLLEYSLPFVKVGGSFLCMKGPGVFEENEEAKKAMDILGGSLRKILPTKIYNSQLNHYIAIIDKVKLCPGKYPRKAGIVEKKPLK